MDIVPLLISLGSGALGGNAAGALLKKFSLGPIGNSLSGIVGGGLGGTVLSMLGIGAPAAAAATGAAATGAAAASSGMDIGSIIGSVAGGGVGGGLVMSVIGMIKNSMGKK